MNVDIPQSGKDFLFPKMTGIKPTEEILQLRISVFIQIHFPYPAIIAEKRIAERGARQPWRQCGAGSGKPAALRAAHRPHLPFVYLRPGSDDSGQLCGIQKDVSVVQFFRFIFQSPNNVSPQRGSQHGGRILRQSSLSPAIHGRIAETGRSPSQHL